MKQPNKQKGLPLSKSKKNVYTGEMSNMLDEVVVMPGMREDGLVNLKELHEAQIAAGLAPEYQGAAGSLEMIGGLGKGAMKFGAKYGPKVWAGVKNLASKASKAPKGNFLKKIKDFNPTRKLEDALTSKLDVSKWGRTKKGNLIKTKRVKEAIADGKIDPNTLEPIGSMSPNAAKVVEYVKKGIKGAAAIGATKGMYDSATGQGGKEYEDSTYYKDEFGEKYRLVNGKKVYEQGGFSLGNILNKGPQQFPGGVATPIGNGAIQFDGNSHDQAGMGSDSGIILDSNTEVEGGETMTNVDSPEGPQEYIFSQKLEMGGIPFSEHHKQMAHQGAPQEKINMLAKMQEHVAGRNPGDISTGRYDEGGPVTADGVQLTPEQQEYFRLLETQDERYSNTGPYEDPQMYEDHDGDGVPNHSDPEYKNSRDMGTALNSAQKKAEPSKASNLPRFKAYTDSYDSIVDASNEAGYSGKGRAKDLGEEGIARTQGKNKDGSYGSSEISSEEARKDFYNRNRDILNGMGVNSWDEFNPKEHTAEFQNKFNDDLADKYDNDDNFRASLEARGISREEFMKSGFEGDGVNAVDGLYGENTFSKTSMNMSTPEKESFVKSDKDFSEEYEEHLKSTGDGDDEGDDKGDYKKDYTDKAIYAAQALPSLMALTERPDYMKDANKVAPGVVVAEREAKQHLDRVDYTDQLARNAGDAHAMNRFIETSGGVSSNIINKMAMFARKNKQDSAIKSAETQANTQISNQEASINAGVNARNASNALSASSTNAGNILAANTTNVRNDMYVDEFNTAADAATKDRRLMAVDSLAKGLVQMRGDTLAYQAQDAYSRAVSGQSGTYEREKMKRLAQNAGVKPGSDQWNTMFGED